MLEGNTFKHNSSQENWAVVEIMNYNQYITNAQLNGGSFSDGDYVKRLVKIYNNTFEDNGAHSTGVLFIEQMPNVEILHDNIFSFNTDEVDFNTAVRSNFIDNRYYL